MLSPARRKQNFSWAGMCFPPLGDGLCCCELSLSAVVRGDRHPCCTSSASPPHPLSSPLRECVNTSQPAPEGHGCSEPQLTSWERQGIAEKGWLSIRKLGFTSTDTVFTLKVTPRALKVALPDCWLLFCIDFNTLVAC